MPNDLVYEVASAEKAQSIVDELTDDGYRAYSAPSPEVGRVRVHVATTAEAREAVDGVVARHDAEAVAIV